MSIRRSFRRIECEECGDTIQVGDPIYFLDDIKICENCAEDASIVCPECGGQRKPEFPKCYECQDFRKPDVEFVVGEE